KSLNYLIELIQLCCFISFLSAGSSDVIREVGDSVQLEIKGSVSEFDNFFWTFNATVNVLQYYKQYKEIKPSTRYKDRVKFNEETYSLTLKNLQKTDSGLYEVKAFSRDHTSSATYRLSVLDPVEPPVLNHRRIAKPCNSTLTCRGHDLSINSTCNNETCEEKEVTSPGGVALSLYVQESIIFCNHSNPVSWKQANKTFTELCAHTDSLQRTANQNPLCFLSLLPTRDYRIKVCGLCARLCSL
uniref:Immunoglobulin domain-containing protein n=1 Tax=Astyanax mexicanus TaxID=7994 RepID=A0A3B1KDF2_ASTMX